MNNLGFPHGCSGGIKNAGREATALPGMPTSALPGSGHGPGPPGERWGPGNGHLGRCGRDPSTARRLFSAESAAPPRLCNQFDLTALTGI